VDEIMQPLDKKEKRRKTAFWVEHDLENRFPLFGVMLYPLKRRIRRLDWAATFSDSVGFP
jgi:hypothetical protein